MYRINERLDKSRIAAKSPISYSVFIQLVAFYSEGEAKGQASPGILQS
jgi:hypothetical protein